MNSGITRQDLSTGRDAKRLLYFGVLALLVGPLVGFVMAFGVIFFQSSYFGSPPLDPTRDILGLMLVFSYIIGIPCVIILLVISGLYLIVTGRLRFFEMAFISLFTVPLVSSIVSLMGSDDSALTAGKLGGAVISSALTSLPATAACWGLAVLMTGRFGKRS